MFIDTQELRPAGCCLDMNNLRKKIKYCTKRLDISQQWWSLHRKEFLQRSFMFAHQVGSFDLPIAHRHDDEANVKGHLKRLSTHEEFL